MPAITLHAEVAHALQHGIPVLTSDRGSLKELAGDCSVIVDPESVKSIASGLTRLLTDVALRSALSQKGRAKAFAYSWKNACSTSCAAR